MGAPASKAPRLLPLRRTKLGVDVLTIHYSNVPDYDFAEASEGMSDDQIRQELEIDWTASTDKRVYPEFQDIHISKEPLVFDPTLPLICGWDFGQVPAFCPTQIARNGQWQLFRPIIGSEHEVTGIYQFAERVEQYLRDSFSRPNRLPFRRLKLQHFGDPYGNQRHAQTRAKLDERLELRTDYEVLLRGEQYVSHLDDNLEPVIRERPGWGWVIESGEQSIKFRLNAVRGMLTRTLPGFRPALLCCCEAVDLIHGFKGAYHYKRRQDGTYDDEPEKNWYSHSQDGLQYVAGSMFMVRGEGDANSGRGRSEQRSHAARRRR